MEFTIEKFKQMYLEKFEWNVYNYGCETEEQINASRKHALIDILKEYRSVSIILEDGNMITYEPEHMSNMYGFNQNGVRLFSDFLYSYAII